MPPTSTYQHICPFPHHHPRPFLRVTHLCRYLPFQFLQLVVAERDLVQRRHLHRHDVTIIHDLLERRKRTGPGPPKTRPTDPRQRAAVHQRPRARDGPRRRGPLAVLGGRWRAEGRGGGVEPRVVQRVFGGGAVRGVRGEEAEDECLGFGGYGVPFGAELDLALDDALHVGLFAVEVERHHPREHREQQHAAGPEVHRGGLCLVH
mmetsp:Transcript_9554/g.25065  ORF Transcript_9554/g.25065 Transcript_9554/m.25065 type:complete len:205 (-) Transcript_9554:374-988(-)